MAEFVWVFGVMVVKFRRKENEEIMIPDYLSRKIFFNRRGKHDFVE